LSLFFPPNDQGIPCPERHKHVRRIEVVHRLTTKLLPQGHDIRQCSRFESRNSHQLAWCFPIFSESSQMNTRIVNRSGQRSLRPSLFTVHHTQVFLIYFWRYITLHLAHTDLWNLLQYFRACDVSHSIYWDILNWNASSRTCSDSNSVEFSSSLSYNWFVLRFRGEVGDASICFLLFIFVTLFLFFRIAISNIPKLFVSLIF